MEGSGDFEVAGLLKTVKNMETIKGLSMEKESEKK